MTPNKKKLLLVCGWGLLAGWIMPAAAAEEGGARGWYIGASAGGTTPKAANFSNAQSGNYDAGYRFEYLSSELNYSDFGRFRHNDAAATDSDVRVWGVALTAIPRYEISSWLAVEGLLGVYRWQRKAQALGVQLVSDEGTDATVGVGVWCQIKGGVALTLRLQRYDNRSGTDLIQNALGVQYVFH